MCLYVYRVYILCVKILCWLYQNVKIILRFFFRIIIYLVRTLNTYRHCSAVWVELMKQTFVEMLNQSSMLGNLRMLFYRGYGWGGVVAVVVVVVGRGLCYLNYTDWSYSCYWWRRATLLLSEHLQVSYGQHNNLTLLSHGIWLSLIIELRKATQRPCVLECWDAPKNDKSFKVFICFVSQFNSLKVVLLCIITWVY